MKGKFTKIMAALALLVFMTPSLAGWGQTRTEVTWTASEQGYENAEDVTSITIDENIGGLFSAGTNTSNSPKYYTTGSGVRMYNNNTLLLTKGIRLQALFLLIQHLAISQSLKSVWATIQKMEQRELGPELLHRL